MKSCSKGGVGEGQGDPNVPLPIPFNPDSTPFSLAYVSLRFFDCKILHFVVYLSLFLPLPSLRWESHFPPSLFPLTVHLSFFLWDSRPPPTFRAKACNCDWFRFTSLCDRLTTSHHYFSHPVRRGKTKLIVESSSHTFCTLGATCTVFVCKINVN